MDIEYNPSFEPYLESEARFAVLFGGAGSGKSHVIAQKHIIRCLRDNEKHKMLFVRKVKNTLRGSVYAITKDLCSEYGLIADGRVKPHDTNMEFRFGNGNEIITSGLDDVEKLKSIHGITSIWFEEIFEGTEDDLDQLNLRLRGITDSYKQISVSFNPVSQEHWLYYRFFDSMYKGYIDDAFIMKSNYKDNLFLDEQYINELTKRYLHDPQKKRIYVDGRWGHERFGGEFYSAYDPDKHLARIGLIKGVPLHLTFDFNINPYAPASVWQIIKDDKGKYWNRCFDEIALENPRNTTEEVCNEFLNRYSDEAKGMFYYGDATGRHRTPASNRHNYDVINDTLREYVDNSSNRVPRRNPLHKKKRLFINKILAGGYPEIGVLIDEKCTKMIADFEGVQEDADGRKWSPKGKTKAGVVYEKLGHLSDGFDYLIVEAFRRYYDDFSLK